MSNLTLTHRSLNYEGLLEGILTCLACDIGQLSLEYTTICHVICCCYVLQNERPIPRHPKMSSHHDVLSA